MLRWTCDSDALDVGRGAKEKRRRRRSSRTEVLETRYIDVDVGTKTPLRIHLGDCVYHDTVSLSRGSMLERVVLTDNAEKTVVVRWCSAKFAALDKDDTVIDMVSQYVAVPVYEKKHHFYHESMHVSVGLRKYIHGTPLSECIRNTPPAMLQHYASQVSAMMMAAAKEVQRPFGHILDGKLQTESACTHINNRVLFERIHGNKYMDHEAMHAASGINAEEKPVLCHGSLWPEHIIVEGTNVQGIVGWSSADFTIESLDRILYSMCDERRREYREWRQLLVDTPTVGEHTELSDITAYGLLPYCRALSMDRCEGKSRRHIDSVVSAVSKGTALMPHPLRPSSTRPGSDGASLSALTDNTLDTWEKSTNATVTC